MGRPRSKNRQLPSYCYRDRRNAAYYMLIPAGIVDGTQKLRRKTYGTDLHRMLADWADIWGTGNRVGHLVGDTMDAYLGVLARKRAKKLLAESTERDYQKHLGSLRPVWGHVRWEDFDAPAIARWQEARGAQSVVQCNRELTVLGQVAKLAGQLGQLKDNPLRFIDRLRETPRDRFVTDDEFAAVFAHAPKVVRAAMFIASITGLRQGDILRLRRADFTEAGLLVPTRKTKKPILFEWTGGLRQAYAMGLAVRKFDSLHWLVRRDGVAYTEDGFRSMWHRAITKAQDASRPKSPDPAVKLPPTLERFTFHDLRAKAGSESRDWKLLGHLDQKTFERVYNRLPRKVAPTR
jgi:integrase